MKKYNSYAEAKIDNPDCEVYRFFPRNIADDGYYLASESDINGAVMVNGCFLKCNPADHCMTLESFLASGRKLVFGDLYITSTGKASSVESSRVMNEPQEADGDIYILRAKALEPKLKLEWANGDECAYRGGTYIFVGVTPTLNDESCVIYSKGHGIEHVSINALSKPEAPTEKAKREALALLNPDNYGMASSMVEAIVDKLSNAGMLKSKDEK